VPEPVIRSKLTRVPLTHAFLRLELLSGRHEDAEHCIVQGNVSCPRASGVPRRSLGERKVTQERRRKAEVAGVKADVCAETDFGTPALLPPTKSRKSQFMIFSR
jgi:hypothetical protein